MVMTDENAAGIGQNGCLKDFSSCRDNHTGCADNYFREVDDVPNVIQIEDNDTFCCEVSQIFFHEFQDFFSDNEVSSRIQGEYFICQLVGRKDFGCIDGHYHLFEHVWFTKVFVDDNPFVNTARKQPEAFREASVCSISIVSGYRITEAPLDLFLVVRTNMVVSGSTS